jgi:hypothetical protein
VNRSGLKNANLLRIFLQTMLAIPSKPLHPAWAIVSRRDDESAP